IDILPILIHGTGYTMTKGDFLLKDGKISIKYLPRIKKDSTHLGVGYAEKTKLISRYFKEEYRKLSIETEQPGYFKEQLIYNFLYKGPLLEWQLRIRLRLEKNYAGLHTLLPRKGKMLHIGCEYGFATYLMHFASKEREFTGIDEDEDKVETANNCFSKDDKINFIFTDALKFQYETYDAIIISDVLPYLQEADQKKVIEKCISSLNPNGSIIIRIKNKNLAPRTGESILTRHPPTGSNGIAAGEPSNLKRQLLTDTAAEYNMKYTNMEQLKYSSDVVFVIKREQLN
ncbi:MAG TPA: class I SAM-dependent methyltransferase, partial [Mucilaginibacter sp.]|nr:class I SAM-dependent methyltransferase [Mucilaginibacter sp.]